MKDKDVMNPENAGQRGHRLPFPTSPVLMAALRALYAGGPKSRWESDFYGHPRYRYKARDGTITFFFSPPPDFGNRFHVSKALYYTPRLAFIYSGSLRAAVHEGHARGHGGGTDPDNSAAER
jgi:hypothetical protein